MSDAARPKHNGSGWICKGDMTDHGGVVIEGYEHHKWNGTPVARLGCKVYCPKCGGIHTITQANGFPVHGTKFAVDKDLTSCGARLLAKRAPPSLVAVAQAFVGGKAYDEGIQFTDNQGRAFGKLNYTLYLDNGETVSGSTDDTGRTGRIVTVEPTAIQKAVLTPALTTCCAANANNTKEEDEAIEVPMQGVTTNSTDLGTSIVVQKVETTERPLTTGEIKMAKLVFGNSLDYDKVKVHNRRFLPLSGNNAMTPFGEMYFPGESYDEDFSNPSGKPYPEYIKIWFIHEMTHVWQYQMGYSTFWHGAWILIKGGYGGGDNENMPRAYRYDTSDATGKKFSDFNMEQQGDIVSRYFGATCLGLGFRDREFNTNVLKQFLKDPVHDNEKNPLLPTTTAF